MWLSYWTLPYNPIFATPPMAVPISWDLSALLLPLSFSFRFNWREGLILILLLHSLPPFHFFFRLRSNLKEGLLVLVLL